MLRAWTVLIIWAVVETAAAFAYQGVGCGAASTIAFVLVFGGLAANDLRAEREVA